jgi:hypothetical protein
VRLNPDYGLYLLRQGYSRNVRHRFYDFPLNHITVVGPGQFTTVKNQELMGVEYATSLDFDLRILAEILRLCPPSIVDFVGSEILSDQVSPRTIQLPQILTLGVETVLGQVQKGLHDDFVPLVIEKVFSVHELKDSDEGH